MCAIGRCGGWEGSYLVRFVNRGDRRSNRRLGSFCPNRFIAGRLCQTAAARSASHTHALQAPVSPAGLAWLVRQLARAQGRQRQFFETVPDIQSLATGHEFNSPNSVSVSLPLAGIARIFNQFLI